jgi:excisionase family DNA binding protein
MRRNRLRRKVDRAGTSLASSERRLSHEEGDEVVNERLLIRVCLNGVWLPVELDPGTPAAIAAHLPDGSRDAKSPYMTVAEAAEYLRWPKKRLYKLTGAGAIPHRKHDGRILFRVEELEAWLDEFRAGPRMDRQRSSAYTRRGPANGPAPRQRPGPGTEGGTFDAIPA